MKKNEKFFKRTRKERGGPALLRVLFTTTALIAALTAGFAACVLEVENTSTIYSVEVSGTAQVGGTLSAVAKDLWGDKVTDAEFQWRRSDSLDGTYSTISGATGDSYTLTASDRGKYVQARATNASSQADWGSTAGWEYSDPVLVRPPDAEITEITAGEWEDGNLAAGGTEWFQFTATAATQYIHIAFGTLSDLLVQVSTSSGAIVETAGGYPYSSTTWEQDMYLGYKYASASVTSGETYFVRVRPYYSSNTGTYRIAFTASSAVPAGNLAE
ncbi:MAG: hypothetical protein MdMp014T_0430 [Treponematales bacterium]